MQLEYPVPDLNTRRIGVRKWSLDDLGCVAAASSDPTIPQGTTVPAEYTDEGGREWIRRQWSRQTDSEGLSLAIVDLGRSTAVGLVYLGLRKPEGNCELGYWVVPRARGCGFATDAVTVASRWVLLHTAVVRLFAHVVPGNEASLRVLEKAGFAREGVLRSFLPIEDSMSDVISLSLLGSDL